MTATSKGPLNYTTTIDPSKTAGECLGLLARHGARRVMMMFGDDGIPDGVAFEVQTGVHGLAQYKLPVNVAGTHAALLKAYRAGKIPQRFSDLDQAKRTAWRVLLSWLEAQLALIEAGVSVLDEVMLPWELVEPDKTVYQLRQEQRALTAAE